MTTDLVDFLKFVLQPSGTLPAVRIGYHDGTGCSAFYTKDFIDEALDEMGRRLMSHHLMPVSALERLGIELLLASANASKPREREQNLAEYVRWRDGLPEH